MSAIVTSQLPVGRVRAAAAELARCARPLHGERNKMRTRSHASMTMPRLPGARRIGVVGAGPRRCGRRHDAGRVHRQVADVGVEGALRIPGALHRPVSSAGRADTGGSRPVGRVVLLRARRAEGHRWRRLGRRVEARLLRVGVQGPSRRSRHGVRPAAAVRDGSLTLSEFAHLWRETMHPVTVRAFQRLDTDGDAVISRTEHEQPLGDFVLRLNRNADGSFSRRGGSDHDHDGDRDE